MFHYFDAIGAASEAQNQVTNPATLDRIARELVLSWPARELHPNDRPHWATKSKAAKAARAEGGYIALQAGWKALQLPPGRLHLWIDFDPPDRRRRDGDGLLSSVKAHIDGIADELGINDSRFVFHPYVTETIHKGGRVRVRISSGPDGSALAAVGVNA